MRFRGLPANTLPADKLFVEWNTSPDGLGTGYQVGDTINNIVSDIDLYLIVRDNPNPPNPQPHNSYVVTIDGNHSGAITTKTTVEANTQFVIPRVKVSPVKRLIGFSTSLFGGKQYDVGDSLLIDRDVTLYVLAEHDSGGGSTIEKDKGELAEGKERNGNNFILSGGISVSKGIHRGYIEGFPDRTFGGEKKLSRAQFAVVLDRVFDFQNKTITKHFGDVKDGWYKDAVELLAS